MAYKLKRGTCIWQLMKNTNQRLTKIHLLFDGRLIRNDGADLDDGSLPA